MKKLMGMLGSVAVAVAVQAGTIWTEDFTDVAEWAVLDDPMGGSQISSDGSLGYLKVQTGSNQVSFAPAADLATLAEFDAKKKKNYALTFTVDKVSSSCSYQIALDEFAAKNGGYVGTVWAVFPPSGSTITTGTFTVDLGKFDFSKDTKYVLPKILVSSGEPNQTVKIDQIRLEYVP